MIPASLNTMLMDQPVSSVFSPLTLPNLTAWYDASDYSTITESSSLVSQWNDKTANGRNLVLGAIAPVPLPMTYTATDIDAFNKPSIGNLDATNFVGLKPLSTIPLRVMYAVMKANGVSVFTGFPTILSGTTGTGTPRIMGNNGTANLISTTTIASTVSVNGGAETATILPLPQSVCRFTSSTLLNQQWRLGYNESGANRSWLGSFSEILIFENVLSSTDETNLLNYLYDKWGITP